MEALALWSCFLRLVDYFFTGKNMDGTELLKLLYQSLRAL